MSFSAEVFKKKLDLLQETQESIVSISQWVLFHHRHARDLCRLWGDYTLRAQRLAKKLSLLYLCNDVVQEARHKRKPEFSAEFALILPKTLHAVYPTLDGPIKPKVDRLVGVWELRNIFGASDIKAMRDAIEKAKKGHAVDSAAAEPERPPTAAVATDLVHLNNLYLHLAQLQETCQANLTQVGIQSKTYLPHDHLALDNLPLPAVYISKLNVLEKLCNLTTKNLADIKSTRQEISTVLAGLQNLVAEGNSTDALKQAIIAKKLERLNTTRAELREMVEPAEHEEPEVESPVFEPLAADSTDGDLVPTYEDSSDDDEDRPVVKKRKMSDSLATSLSLAVSLSLASKKVAFSEDIQIKEFHREEHTGELKIVKSDTESEDDYVPEYDEPEPSDLKEFEAKHKDDVELLHEKTHDDKSGLLSLLSKLS